jgi:hypothetical protein
MESRRNFAKSLLGGALAQRALAETPGRLLHDLQLQV